MKKRLLALLCAFLAAGAGQSFIPSVEVKADEANTYYISSLHGDNSKSGKSQGEAWETLDKLKGVTLNPGDQILLENGSEFNGYIHLKDVHGTEDAPIKIGTYGPLPERPVINANGQGVWYQSYEGTVDNPNHRSKGYVSSVILLYDVDFVEVSGLELTNKSDDFDFFEGAVFSASQIDDRMDRTGVSGIAKDGGTMQHVYLNNLYIHDVDGNIEDKHMNNGGIQMNVLPPADEEATGIARYDDVKVTNCHVKNVSRAGICVGYTYQGSKFSGKVISDETAQKYGHTNLLMEGNYVQNVGNDGIVAMYAYRPLIQRNVSDKAGADLEIYTSENTPEEYAKIWQPFCAAIWPWKCKDAVFQYNEAFDTVDCQDGQPWDVDWSDGTVYQYNYSHNNGGGCIMICGTEAYQGVFRYNISQNDLKGLIGLADNNPNADIYNNVFYIGKDLDTKLFIDKSNYNGTAAIKNNIFYNDNKNKSTETIVKAKRTYATNIFWGYGNDTLPEGSIKEDPKFVDPGKGPGSSLGGALHEKDAFGGYKLQNDSPAINRGTLAGGAAKYDFFGNQVGVQPDIGAYESDVPETELALGGDSITVENGKIKGFPQNITVGELKEKLIYARDTEISFKEGSRQMQDTDAVTEDTVITISRDGKTAEYTVGDAKGTAAVYADYAQSSMTATAGSEEDGTSPYASPEDKTLVGNVLDGNNNTIWNSKWSHSDQSLIWIQLDLKSVKPVARLTYVPRQNGDKGIFTKYKVEISENGQTWTQVAAGDWTADTEEKYAQFNSVNARYVKLTALDSVLDNGRPTGSAAEIRIGYLSEE